MLFTNLMIMHFYEGVRFDAEQLEEALQRRRFRPTGQHEPVALGWVAPVGKGEDAPLVHAANGCYMVCLKREERLLPGVVVEEEVQARVEAHEARRGSYPSRQERDDIRDAVLNEFMPRAFTRATRLYAYIDTRGGWFVGASAAPAVPTKPGGWLVVDTASADRCGDLVALLRQCLGTLPVVSASNLNARPDFEMTQWLIEGGKPLPEQFETLQNCRLKSPEHDGGEVVIKKAELSGEEVQVHLGTGKEVVELGLVYAERLQFTLTHTLRVKRLRFLDAVFADDPQDYEDAAAKFDGDIRILTTELGEFLPKLVAAFGGLAKVA